MTTLIFLDIDGVLNSTEFIAQQMNDDGISVIDETFDATAHIDPARVERLNRLIEGTGARVVLSSNWRLLFGLHRTQSSLRQKGFVHELSDETPRIFGSDRHAEIKAYLATLEQPVRFVVLDDDEIAGVDLEDHFVHVPDGLEDEHVERARKVLASP
jgi:hypothetical protein